MDIEKYVYAPLQVIEQLYVENGIERHEAIQAHFKQLFRSDCDLLKIPLLNVTPVNKLVDGQLVRISCMVQYFNQEEFSYAVYTHKKDRDRKRLCKYRDHMDDMEEWTYDESSLYGRCIITTINVPGENIWVHEEKSRKETCHDVEDYNSTYTANSCSQVPTTYYIIKLYDTEHDLKLNQTIELVGIYSKENLSSPIENIVHQLEEFKLNETRRNADIITIHALFYEKQTNDTLDLENSKVQQTLQSATRIRENIIEHLTRNITTGDTVAAEYLLIHLISRIYLTKGLTILGKFDLNIFNYYQEEGKGQNVAQCISNLLSKNIFLPLTLERLNQSENHMPLRPRQRENDDYLLYGLLQFSDYTHITIDETCLNEGKLDQQGLENLKSLNDILATNRLVYEFPFFQQELDAKCSALILSEGKSMFPSICQIPLRPRECLCANDNILDEVSLFEFRQYLSTLQYLPFELDSEITSYIENDFVQQRHQKAENNISNDKLPSGDDLHYQLTLGRLLALSFGETRLTPERWTYMKQIEQERHHRHHLYASNSSFLPQSSVPLTR